MRRDFTGTAWLAVAALIVALPGCGSDEATTTTSHTTFTLDITGGPDLELSRNSDGVLEGTAYGVNVRFEGVDIDIPGSTGNVEAGRIEGTGHGGKLLVSVEGHAARITEGVLYLGETSYGAVVEGDDVEVTGAGVTVNGENRGALPGS